MLRMEGQLGEIDLVAGLTISCTGASADCISTTGCGFAHAAANSAAISPCSTPKAAATRLRLPADGGDHLVMLGAGFLEEHRFRRLLDDRAHIGERDRLLMHLDLADLDQLSDEIPQPEFLEVHLASLDRHLMYHRTLLPDLAGFSRFLRQPTGARNMVNARQGKQNACKTRVIPTPELKSVGVKPWKPHR